MLHSTPSLTLSSPAKINLFLHIVKKREDGFHELASLFSAVSLFDKLTFTLSKNDAFTCTNPYLPVDSSNLVIKALHLFRKKTGWNPPVALHLEKNIPFEAGLGGGSGNAATVLWGLNRLAQLGLTDQTLMEWGAELGSDVPFFFSLGTAYCTGRGEIVEPFPSLSLQGKKLYLIKPPYGLSTPLVYRELNHQGVSNQPVRAWLNRIQQGDLVYFNDLEQPALRLRPDLQRIQNELIELGFERVVLCGSGTAFFCIGDQPMPSLPGLDVYAVDLSRRCASSDWY